MTDHSITPPPELVQQWLGTYFGTTVTGEVSEVELALATQAARWGSDQELEACCEWMEDADLDDSQRVSWVKLRAARRPEPPSLKAQALTILDDPYRGGFCEDEIATIRRALEAIND